MLGGDDAFMGVDCLCFSCGLLLLVQRLNQRGGGGGGVAQGVEQGDELAAHDDAARVAVGGLARGAVADAETDEPGVAQFHCLEAGEVSLLGVDERPLRAGDTGRTYGVDEARRPGINLADARLAGLGRHEEDEVHARRLGLGAIERVVLLERQVGDDAAVYAQPRAVGDETLRAVGQHHVVVAHQEQRYVYLGAHAFEFDEEAAQRHTALQGARGGVLDDGAVGDGVAEGDAYFHHVDTAVLQGAERGADGRGRGVARAEIDGKNARGLGGEKGGDAGHKGGLGLVGL